MLKNRIFRYSRLFRYYEFFQPYLKFSMPVERDLPSARALVIAPHPDDETIGCGATICAHAAKGLPVKAVFMTMDAARREESRTALEILGIGESESLGYTPDKIDVTAASARLADLIESWRPDIVFAPFLVDNHADHRAANEALVAAVRRLSESREKNPAADFLVYAYPVWLPLIPNVLSDAGGGAWAVKMKAIAVYRSQTATRDYVSMAEGLASYWAAAKNLAPATRLESFFRATAQEYSRLYKKIYK